MLQEVKISEFKCLKNIEKDIAGRNVLLIGDNGVGKSSFIQFIRIALGDQSCVPPNATGEGHIVYDKNGKKYTLFVKFKDGKPVITVDLDGMKDSRKGVLANLVGAMDFDIDAFVELSKTAKGRRDQVEIFKGFLDEETKSELARFAANIKANYDTRTDVNKTLKEKEGAIKQHSLYNRVNIEKFEPVDVQDVYKQLKEATDKNAQIVSAQAEAKNIEAAIIRENSEIVDLKNKLAALELSLKANADRREKAAKWLSENTVVDISEFEATIRTATDRNNECNAAILLKKEMETVEALKEEAGELTAKIESERGAIETAIRDMKTPIQGLAFDDEQLLYNGIPVNPDSLSTSEIMELGVRLKMAENPELGILFIERGESLGAKRLKEIQEIAEKNNFQIIMEQVERGKEKLEIEIMQG